MSRFVYIALVLAMIGSWAWFFFISGLSSMIAYDSNPVVREMTDHQREFVFGTVRSVSFLTAAPMALLNVLWPLCAWRLLRRSPQPTNMVAPNAHG